MQAGPASGATHLGSGHEHPLNGRVRQDRWPCRRASPASATETQQSHVRPDHNAATPSSLPTVAMVPSMPLYFRLGPEPPCSCSRTLAVSMGRVINCARETPHHSIVSGAPLAPLSGHETWRAGGRNAHTPRRARSRHGCTRAGTRARGAGHASTAGGRCPIVHGCHRPGARNGGVTRNRFDRVA